MLVISSLTSGGAERVMTLLADYWVNEGADVTLLTLFPKEKDFYELNLKVQRIVLNQGKPSSHIVHAVYNNIKRLSALRSSFQQVAPDYIISFLDATNILTLLASRGLDIPVIVSERNDPREKKIGAIRGFLRNLLYPKAHTLVVQTESVAKWAEQNIPKANVVVIANPVRRLIIENEPIFDKPKGTKTLVAMGSLTYQKGYDLLIPAFSACVNKHKDWKLLIMGEGNLRADLELLVEKYRMTDHIIFLGRIKKPETVLASANMYVLSSRFEGFPNALLEAMACGLPVISFDCPSGPSDIITHGENGLLVKKDNVDELQKAMLVLMEDQFLCQTLAKEAKLVCNKFSIEKIIDAWDALM